MLMNLFGGKADIDRHLVNDWVVIVASSFQDGKIDQWLIGQNVHLHQYGRLLRKPIFIKFDCSLI